VKFIELNQAESMVDWCVDVLYPPAIMESSMTKVAISGALAQKIRKERKVSSGIIK
jgi:hypothetical protein